MKTNLVISWPGSIQNGYNTTFQRIELPMQVVNKGNK